MQQAPIVSAALVAATVPAVPTWGPATVELFGLSVPVASMALSLLGLAMARAVSGAREGRAPGDWYLTVLLAVLLVALVAERKPGPGLAVAWGVGLGTAGIVVVDLLKKFVVERVRGLLRGAEEDAAAGK